LSDFWVIHSFIFFKAHEVFYLLSIIDSNRQRYEKGGINGGASSCEIFR